LENFANVPKNHFPINTCEFTAGKAINWREVKISCRIGEDGKEIKFTLNMP
jgi:hypothetical protein